MRNILRKIYINKFFKWKKYIIKDFLIKKVLKDEKNTYFYKNFMKKWKLNNKISYFLKKFVK